MTHFKVDNSGLDPEEEFDIVGILGEGSYGEVLEGIHKKTGERMALKKITIPEESNLDNLLKEIKIHKELSDCENVVRFRGSYLKNEKLWIAMEPMLGGSLTDVMRANNRVFTEPEIAYLMKSVIRGLVHIHRRKKVHRDIKAENIMLSLDGEAKIADFGVSAMLTDEQTKRRTVIGTPFWMAPEVISETGYSTEADIWSLGITGIELAEGRPPHADLHPLRAIFKIPQAPPPTLSCADSFSDEFNDFISKCCRKNPKERPPARDLLSHPFIARARDKSIIDDCLQIAIEYYEKHGRGFLDDSECGTDDMSTAPTLRTRPQPEDDDEDYGGTIQLSSFESGTTVLRTEDAEGESGSDVGAVMESSSDMGTSDSEVDLNQDKFSLDTGTVVIHNSSSGSDTDENMDVKGAGEEGEEEGEGEKGVPERGMVVVTSRRKTRSARKRPATLKSDPSATAASKAEMEELQGENAKLKTELAELREIHFCSLVLNAKLMQPQNLTLSNSTQLELWERMLKEKVPWTKWASWIMRQLNAIEQSHARS